MRTRKQKKLTLSRETMHSLSLEGVVGGLTTLPCQTGGCPVSNGCTVQNCPSRPPICSARIGCLPGGQ